MGPARTTPIFLLHSACSRVDDALAFWFTISSFCPVDEMTSRVATPRKGAPEAADEQGDAGVETDARSDHRTGSLEILES